MLLVFQLNSIKNVLAKKTIIALLALCLVSTTLWIGFKDDIINHSENNIQLLLLSAPYVIVSIIAVFIYKIKPGP